MMRLTALAFALASLAGCGSGVGNPPLVEDTGNSNISRAEMDLIEEGMVQVRDSCRTAGFTSQQIDAVLQGVMADVIAGIPFGEELNGGRLLCDEYCGPGAVCYTNCVTCTDGVTILIYGSVGIAAGY